jgi:hypothetical protein
VRFSPEFLNKQDFPQNMFLQIFLKKERCFTPSSPFKGRLKRIFGVL